MDPLVRKVEEKKAALVDVRRDDEWEAGHAEGALHLDIEKIEKGEMPSLPKDMPIYLYCRSGGRAGRAKTILKENGFTNVENLGGLSDWEDMGGKVAKSKIKL